MDESLLGDLFYIREKYIDDNEDLYTSNSEINFFDDEYEYDDEDEDYDET